MTAIWFILGLVCGIFVVSIVGLLTIGRLSQRQDKLDASLRADLQSEVFRLAKMLEEQQLNFVLRAHGGMAEAITMKEQ